MAQAAEYEQSDVPAGDRADTIRALCRQWKDHRDLDARDELLRLHAGWIRSIARRYPARLGHDDFQQEAQMGFLRALDTFDPDRGTALSTYARHWIRAYVHRYLLRGWSVVPQFLSHDRRRVFFGAGRARAALGITQPRPGDERAIARRLRVKPEVVLAVESARGVRDAELLAPDGPAERLACDLPGPDEQAWALERARLLRERLPAALAALSARERDIFLERADPDEGVTLEELGVRLGITGERVRQIEVRARSKLAEALADLAEPDAAARAMRAPPPRRWRARARVSG